MNLRHCFCLPSLLALMMIAGCQRAPVQTVGAIEIESPWIRAMAPNAPTAGGFVVLRNTGSTPDRLVSASTADAQRVEIHEARMEQGMMRMRALPGGLPLPAGSTVRLEPGAHHLMLVAPRRRFAQGESVALELVFERAGSARVAFPVRPIQATSADGAAHH